MKIVCIGGGHGLSQVLSALTNSDHELTAIIATTDNGGSTGRLRHDKSQIAFGDIRRCISSLAPSNLLLNQLIEHRFTLKNELESHSMGNIMLSALSQMTATPSDAINLMCALLDVQHTILPMSDEPVDLVATLSDGTTVFGECAIDALTTVPKLISLSQSVSAQCQAIHAIKQADFILLGPGSILTSVIPPLLIPEYANALKHTSACRIYIENVTKENSVMDHIPQQEQTKWACDLLGYQFFDIAVSPDAFSSIYHFHSQENGLNPTTRYQQSQLKQLIDAFIPSDVKPSDEFNHLVH